MWRKTKRRYFGNFVGFTPRHFPAHKIMGHSLGGGKASLVTFILREQKELSRATCYTFASAACMTWELAESGNEFITSIINGADIVPTFSAASMDDLRAEDDPYLASNVLNSFSATTKARVTGAGAILLPVFSGTQVVMRRAQSMAQAAWTRPTIHLSSWSCIVPRRRNTVTNSRPKDGSDTECSISDKTTDEPLLAFEQNTASRMTIKTVELPISSCERIEWRSETEVSYSEDICVESENYTGEDGGEDLNSPDQAEDRMTEEELWQQLENELYNRADGEELDVAKEIKEEEEEEEAAVMAEEGMLQDGNSSPSENKDVHRFFPRGRTLHLVTLPRDPQSNSPSALDDDIDPRVRMLHPPSLDSPTLGDSGDGSRVSLFYTPRSLYSKIRLSQTMIRDHFIPIYRRQIDRVIKELEKDDEVDDNRDVFLLWGFDLYDHKE